MFGSKTQFDGTHTIRRLCKFAEHVAAILERGFSCSSRFGTPAAKLRAFVFFSEGWGGVDGVEVGMVLGSGWRWGGW